MSFRRHCNWYVKRFCKVLEIWAAEALECCMQNLMNDSGQGSQNQNSFRTVEGRSKVHEVSDANKDSSENLTRYHVYSHCQKNHLHFSHVLRHLWEGEFLQQSNCCDRRNFQARLLLKL